MAPQLRHYRTDDDYWRAREFFRSLPRPDGRPGGNWHLAEFDYWRWHWLENVVERNPTELCLWESDGRIVAVLNQGDPGVCHLHVRAEARTPELVREMVETAESEYSTPLETGGRAVFVLAGECDGLLTEALAARGYGLLESAHAVEHNGRCRLLALVEPPAIPDGFLIRSMGDVDEHSRRSLASWRAFHPDEPDGGCDRTGAWYRVVQRAPLYRRDLDVVAIAPNGDIASFAVCYFDDAARTGVFVLEGTVPAYERRGLARAVMAEALRRLEWFGATDAFVSWYEPPAGALYESVGFLEQERERAWMKRL